MSNYSIVGVGAIVRFEDKFLVVEEFNDDESIDKKRFSLSFPSGKLDASESIIDCVKREVFEETGYAIFVEGLIGIYRIKGAVGFAYSAMLDQKSQDSRKISKSEISKVLWLTREEIMNLSDRFRPANIKILDDYFSKKHFSADLISDYS